MPMSRKELQQENYRLRWELVQQWSQCHALMCQTKWPHEHECGWPPPATLTVEECAAVHLPHSEQEEVFAALHSQGHPQPPCSLCGTRLPRASSRGQGKTCPQAAAACVNPLGRGGKALDESSWMGRMCVYFHVALAMQPQPTTRRPHSPCERPQFAARVTARLNSKSAGAF